MGPKFRDTQKDRERERWPRAGTLRRTLHWRRESCDAIRLKCRRICYAGRIAIILSQWNNLST